MGNILEMKIKNLTQEFEFNQNKLAKNQQEQQILVNKMIGLKGAIDELKKLYEETKRISMTTPKKILKKKKDSKRKQKKVNK